MTWLCKIHRKAQHPQPAQYSSRLLLPQTQVPRAGLVLIHSSIDNGRTIFVRRHRPPPPLHCCGSFISRLVLGAEPVRAERTRTAREKGSSRSAEMVSWTAGDKKGPGRPAGGRGRRRAGVIVSREVEDWRVERAVWSARPHARPVHKAPFGPVV